MIEHSISAVIGKNFGDEGKGLAVDYLCSKSDKNLVIRHNGGAQAGHTVDLPETRFVFHQLSSGSFRGADTFWTKNYFPDLYKLNEEIEGFRKAAYDAGSDYANLKVRIFSEESTPVTLIDDVIFNMILETSRGMDRHGSCGMGIYEALLRTQTGFGVTVGDVKNSKCAELVKMMSNARYNYYLPRLKGILEKCSSYTDDIRGKIEEYASLMQDENVLFSAAEEMIRAASCLETVSESDLKDFLKEYKQIIFETGQGLLLDADREEYWPNVTGSKTGLTNIVDSLNEWGLRLNEVCYVTRSYVTRHGAGRLPGEIDLKEMPEYGFLADKTNTFNEWQGGIRYAKHVDIENFWRPVLEDYEKCLELNTDIKPGITLFITHLNETGEELMFDGGNLSLKEFVEKSTESGKNQAYDFLNNKCIMSKLKQIYVSKTPYSKDVEIVDYAYI